MSQDLQPSDAQLRSDIVNVTRIDDHESIRQSADTRPLLLLFNLRNVGHFTIYCHNFTLWALSRGFEVAYCGLNVEETAYYTRFSRDLNVRFIEMHTLLGLEIGRLDDAAVLERFCKDDGTARQVEALRLVQLELLPHATVLMNADEFFFNYPLENADNDLFATPTYGILTFGHRDCYTGCDEKYAWRLRRIPRDGTVFKRLLTIDEYHVAFDDPDQRFLIYLPDPYRNIHEKNINIERNSRIESDHPDMSALRRFLDSDSRPLIPIAGKFDARKNNLWLLEEVAAMPGMCCAVIGDRVASDQDSAIDDLISMLEAQGRIFCCFGFVQYELFDLLFSSPRVPFVAFPYLEHYGSSGIHLMAAEYGKPCLVPDIGLMARRTRNAGLGLLFRHGDREDFRRKFSCLAAGGFKGEIDAFADFSITFGNANLFAALDYTFDLNANPPPLPPWITDRQSVGTKGYVDLINDSLNFIHSRELEAALSCMDEAIGLAPEHNSLLIRRFALMLRTSSDSERCLEAWNRVISSGSVQTEKVFFVKQLTDYLCDIPKGADFVYDEKMLIAVLLHIADDPENLQRLGCHMAGCDRYIEAEALFTRALRMDPDRNSIRLNLSDVLRYAGRLTESHAALDELACRNPNASGLWCKRGQILATEGRIKEAISAFDREIMVKGPYTALAVSWLEQLR
jgi:tetratricopeptide (TPR) repeat protein